MKNKDEKIYLNQTGYEQYLEEVKELEKQLNEHKSGSNDAYTASTGDGWHDNFAFEEYVRKEKALIFQLREKMNRLKNIVIVEKSADDVKSIIDIDDIVEITLTFDENDIETNLYKLIAGTNPQQYGEINEISLNSPLGKAIYLKNLGDKINYSLNNDNIVGIIGNRKYLEGDFCKNCQSK